MSQIMKLILQPCNCISNISGEFCGYWRGLPLQQENKKGLFFVFSYSAAHRNSKYRVKCGYLEPFFNKNRK